MKNHIPDNKKWNQLARQFLGEDFFADVLEAARGTYPCIDVYHGKNEVIVVIDLPGIEDINSLDLGVDGDTFYIKGYFSTPYQAYSSAMIERKRGEFQRTVSLGVQVSPKCTSARYRKGVLELRFPKAGTRKNLKKIRIHSED
ncbi:Hsp20/alpha crystallin family protein [Lihuaxuella thermophila]|uniref:HSP20 family protein n=1 Tax=Lihuaxuella thermophila TaxID=1173111 RepID=A0A1H8IDU4_9BACL|nr:Hsp20/alpha crystallin family protein [Lihuaxuella thermophila]SEN66365.1 HSP20 family protein [Lihuaxuella thermophila]